MKVVAMLDRSQGNDTVGEMWTETHIFEDSEPISWILAWAASRLTGNERYEDKGHLGNIRIQIARGNDEI